MYYFRNIPNTAGPLTNTVQINCRVRVIFVLLNPGSHSFISVRNAIRMAKGLICIITSLSSGSCGNCCGVSTNLKKINYFLSVRTRFLPDTTGEIIKRKHQVLGPDDNPGQKSDSLGYDLIMRCLLSPIWLPSLWEIVSGKQLCLTMIGLIISWEIPTCRNVNYKFYKRYKSSSDNLMVSNTWLL